MLSRILESSSRVMLLLAIINVAIVAIAFSTSATVARSTAGIYLVNGSNLQVVDRMAINSFAGFFEVVSFFVTLAALAIVAVLLAVKWLARRHGVLWYSLLAILCVLAMSPGTTILLGQSMIDIQDDRSWSSLFPGSAEQGGGSGSASAASEAAGALDFLGIDPGRSKLATIVNLSLPMQWLMDPDSPASTVMPIVDFLATAVSLLVEVVFLVLLLIPLSITGRQVWRWRMSQRNRSATSV